ncbi:MAG: OmpA family protein, partial [Bacteroidales bacterium]|nr:OmpA family protein [Bacteroidales bacterium]
MKKIALLLTVLMLTCIGASAQNILNRLGQRAKNAVENNIGNKVERGINDVLNGNTGNNQGNNDRRNRRNNETVEEENYDVQDQEKVDDTPDAVSENVKSDFVRGSVILFQDDFKNEQVGEFPSKWDIQGEGNAETAVINGQKYLSYTTDYNFVEPLMENMKSYLPDVFTLEWDYFCSKQGDLGQSSMELIFDMGRNDRVGRFEFAYRSWNPDCWIQYDFKKPNSDDSVSGNLDWDDIKSYIKVGQWNHFAVSFNKRALKIYINDNRIVNLPNVQAPERFKFWSNGEYKYKGFTNVLLCAGAKELYERETTNLSEAAKAVEQAIAQTGKFVTNNILFDTGKATIKPESQPEIDNVAEYMKANPTIRFEVQCHTDNQGSDK